MAQAIEIDQPGDEVDWSGIKLVSTPVGKRPDLSFNEVSYASLGELRVAQLLTKQRIPFVPDVRTSWQPLGGDREFVYVPDFIFVGKAYFWIGDGSLEPIHGLELKQRCSDGQYPKIGLKKITDLLRYRGIRIRLVDEMAARKMAYLPLYSIQ
ncbi:hypothetical protein A2480_03960 [Candidatus Uhrbacteria bacterium RIFOXYC2_FULL_47_19]|uniref:DUF1064 domain-containing protein n=1 Tax=Candidatus Uhrbacteria bacterium RIFOXYC2_FULL_47_19 TaxID=1802424 RepID=A0A1F7WDB3_9BACT|nr:MAG: hypothetical protein A2480_03960 [Candidatus Uhrbacteria bacterium RIFOXYC2_FULL_47_19]HCC22194.1 hypothetical protein [Candidatus Uhrbacteria bacterium]